jgi:hypothetical protein
MGKAVIQALCQQLSWQLGYLKKLVLFCLLRVDNHLSERLRYLSLTSKGRIASTHYTENRLGKQNRRPTPFPLSIEEDCFDNDIGNSSKATACDLKGLKFESAGQDLEEFIASKENLLELSAIISRNWSTTIDEDDSYIQIPKQSVVVCKVFHSRRSAMIQEWD